MAAVWKLSCQTDVKQVCVQVSLAALFKPTRFCVTSPFSR